jgi:methylase of polypeptide subunit release factors
MTAPIPLVHWTENGVAHSARWRSEAGREPPTRVRVVDDTLTADAAFRLTSEGTALLWRGDFQLAIQLLQAIARRIDSRAEKTKSAKSDDDPAQRFHRHRLRQSQRARTLGTLLIPLSARFVVPLRRAPDVVLACEEAYGTSDHAEGDSIVSLRELMGLVGAHEWRKKGVAVRTLESRIHPHYGVFAPVRGEYVELVARAAFARNAPPPLAFEIGAGTGVLSAVLAKRGVGRVIATELDPRAVVCARANISRLGYEQRVLIEQANLFPNGRAPLIVCNPPWIPARPTAPIENAVYDADGRMLKGFLAGLAAHLKPNGEGWLILSDIAEHLGLRSRDALLQDIDAAGLVVVGRDDARPDHPKSNDRTDPLFAARAKEVTSLWRLRAMG